MNFIEVMGRLGSDPETRHSPTGQKITTFRVATNTRGKNGQDETVWWRVTIWGDRFDKMLPYLKKGSAVVVMGELRKPEVYTDKNGAAQVSLEITAEVIRFSPFGSGKTDQQSNGHTSGANNMQPPYAQTGMGQAAIANPFSMNPMQDMGYPNSDMNYPDMGYDESEQVQSGRSSNKGSVTADDIPF